MYIYGTLDYPVVVVSDLRIKSNESLGKSQLKPQQFSLKLSCALFYLNCVLNVRVVLKIELSYNPKLTESS